MIHVKVARIKEKGTPREDFIKYPDRMLNATEALGCLIENTISRDCVFPEATNDRINLISRFGGNNEDITIFEGGDRQEMMPLVGFVYWWACGHTMDENRSARESARLLKRKIEDNEELGFKERLATIDWDLRAQLHNRPTRVAAMMIGGIRDISDIKHGLAFTCAPADLWASAVLAREEKIAFSEALALAK